MPNNASVIVSQLNQYFKNSEENYQNYNFGVNYLPFVHFNYLNFQLGNSTLNYIFTDWYSDQKEPVSQAGIFMGLKVVLDAHTDILAKYSVPEDFDGFPAIVAPPNDFPLIYRQGFGIKTGN